MGICHGPPEHFACASFDRVNNRISVFAFRCPVLNDDSLAEEAREALERHVIAAFVPRCIDKEYGGFLVDFDGRWRAMGPHEKSLEHAARTTTAFAELAAAMPGQGFEQLARHGCAFLREAMWDAREGGFYARVERSGRPLWEGFKHPHAVTYAARAFLLSQPFLEPGEGAIWAHRALAWLDDVAWDETDLGYWGAFRRDNTRYPDGAHLPTPDGLDPFGLSPGFKEINTQGDAIDVLKDFVKAEPDGGHEARLSVLVQLVCERLIQPRGILPYRYQRDWRPAPDLIRGGYQFQMARHVLCASNLVEAPSAVACTLAFVNFALAFGAHPDGGYCTAVGSDGRSWLTIDSSTDLREWWVQVEAVRTLHALANDARLDARARARYRACRDNLWVFVRDNLFDERYGGMRNIVGPVMPWRRHMRRSLEGAPPNVLSYKSHAWKDISHEVGVFLALTKSG
jgi:mannose/cellobiose epimerase-like protein (N-acyl-D-glucosamine 2-epimerase family)